MSLQQAYSLLLSDEISIIQYKVYASLSRLGYKVFRHFSKSVSNKNRKIYSLTNTDKVDLKGVESYQNIVSSDTSHEVSSALTNETNIAEDIVIGGANDYNINKTEPNLKSCVISNAMEIDDSNPSENNKNESNSENPVGAESGHSVEAENTMEMEQSSTCDKRLKCNKKNVAENNKYEKNAIFLDDKKVMKGSNVILAIKKSTLDNENMPNEQMGTEECVRKKNNDNVINPESLASSKINTGTENLISFTAQHQESIIDPSTSKEIDSNESNFSGCSSK